MLKKDIVRTAARTLAPPRLYASASRWLDSCATIRRQGLQIHRALRHASRQDPSSSIAKIGLRGYRHPIHFRPGTPDVGVIVQNLVREEYGRLPAGFAPEVVVDGGGYIGDLSIYFLNRFPRSRVITLEPDERNRQLAEVNLAPYGDRATLLPNGLWSEQARLSLEGSYTGSSLSTDAASPSINCITIEDLVNQFDLAGIDIVKLDIEGAERQVLLENSAEWLQRTRLLVVEFHGADIEAECTAFLEASGFSASQYRSLHYFCNRRRP
jgi:FkbM family methyltransferase